VKRCAADPGSTFLAGFKMGPDSAAHHSMMRCARDTTQRYRHSIFFTS
jgi:hypothetical protein